MRAIGVAGCGFVGGAVAQGFKPVVDVEIFDLDPNKRTVNSLDELCDKTDGPIFVCVPTPMKPDGSCELKIVKSVVAGIKPGKTVVIKSTIPPGSSDQIAEENPHVKVVFNPEFLTEANFVNDFNNQKHAILGNDDGTVASLFQKRFPGIEVVHTDRKTAEMVKYFTNTFLATKISFANEIFQICEALGIDYNEVKSYATRDERLGKSHWSVPGPMPDHHGKLKPGYSGSCFPKDINALIATAKQLNIKPLVLEAGWNKNIEVRPEKDWEELKGRAVIKNESNTGM